MTIDAAVLIGEGPDSLEGTKVTTPAGTDLFREGVVISDPDNAQGRANVKTLGAQLSTADKGLVVNAIIHGETTGAGGGYRDVKVNPSGALVTDATGSTVALDAASLAALETISVANFPATQVVSDGGGSLTVDGSVAVNNHPASQSVVGAGAAATAQRVQLADESLAALENINALVSGTVSINNTVAVSATDLDIRNLSSAQDSVTVTGSVNVGNFPATQAVSGTVTANLGTLNGAATAAKQLPDNHQVQVSNFPATQAVSDGGGSLTVDGTVAATQSGSWSVAVNNFPATQAVSGTVTANAGTGTFNTRALASGTDSVTIVPSGTQTVSGTVTVAQATAANLNATVTGTVNVGNFPATQAVSGTVTANLGALNGAATSANQTTTNTTLASLDNKIPDESGAWGYNAGTSGTLAVAANKRVLTITATAGLTAGSMTINAGQTITIPANGSITISPKANLVAPTIVFTGTTAYFVEFVE